MESNSEADISFLRVKEADEEDLRRRQNQIKLSMVQLFVCYKKISFYKKKNEDLTQLKENADKIKKEIEDFIRGAKSQEVEEILKEFYQKQFEEQCLKFSIEIHKDWKPAGWKIITGVIFTAIEFCLRRYTEQKNFIIVGPLIFAAGLCDLKKNHYSVSPSNDVTQQPR